MYDLAEGTSTDQLDRMCDLAGREWSWSSRWHPGELTWFWWESGGPAADDRVATWQVDGRAVAWAWLRGGSRLDLQVAAAHRAVLDQVLDWFESASTKEPRSITLLDAETELITAVTARGYRADRTQPFFAHLAMDLPRPLTPAALPDGFTLGPVDGSHDQARRASLHREVFGPPGAVEPSASSYRRLVADPRYDARLDWMVRDADGLPVAFCLGWLDEASSVVALEPVGTLSGYRRQGLATHAITATLAAAQERGATRARVCARVDRDDPGAHSTYAALGFTRYARNVTFAG